MELKKSTLSNGLTVATHILPGRHGVFANLTFNSGSRHEYPDEGGVCHFLEHMLFRGEFIEQKIAEIEAVGGYLTAFTNREFTSIECRILKEYLNPAIEAFAECSVYSEFNDKDLESERNVILQEYYRDLDDRNSQSLTVIYNTLFPNQSLGRDPIGTEKRIKNITARDLKRFKDNNFFAENAVLSVAGDVHHEEVVETAQKYFSSMPRYAADKKHSERFNYIGGNVIADFPSHNQVITRFAFPAPGRLDPAIFPYYALRMMLANGDNSRLYKAIRQTHGNSYDFGAYLNPYEDGSIFLIRFETSPEHVQAIADICKNELVYLSDNISDSELERIKNTWRSSHLINMDDIENASWNATLQGFYGDQESVDYNLKGILSLTKEDIYQAAEELLSCQTPTFMMAGPVRANELEKMQNPFSPNYGLEHFPGPA